MSAKKESYCLVLGGGGAKGVYHIGAWRALRTLGVPVHAFVGNSIGAIIAAFLAQGAYDELDTLGDTITVDTVLKLPPGFVKNGVLKLGDDTLGGLGEIYKLLTRGKGLDTSPMRRNLETLIDEEKIRGSGNDLGMVAVDAADFSPREVFLEDMEPGTLIDYLMASSAFPGFALSEINGRKYLDGGLHDNVPYEMARQRGYTNIIVLDISGVGLAKRPEIQGSRTVYVKNSIKMGNEFDFSRSFLDRYRLLGYLDTMKAFGALDGWQFFVTPSAAAEKRFQAFLRKVGDRASPVSTLLGKGIFPLKMRHDRRQLLKLLDCSATILGVERVREYSYEELAREIAAHKAREDTRIASFVESAKKSGHGVFNEVVASAIKEKRFEACPYYYHELVRVLAIGKAREVLERILFTVNPELKPGLLYFELAHGFFGESRKPVRGRALSVTSAL